MSVICPENVTASSAWCGVLDIVQTDFFRWSNQSNRRSNQSNQWSNQSNQWSNQFNRWSNQSNQWSNQSNQWFNIQKYKLKSEQIQISQTNISDSGRGKNVIE